MFSKCWVLIFSKNREVNLYKADKGDEPDWVLVNIHIKYFTSYEFNIK